MRDQLLFIITKQLFADLVSCFYFASVTIFSDAPPSAFALRLASYNSTDPTVPVTNISKPKIARCTSHEVDKVFGRAAGAPAGSSVADIVSLTRVFVRFFGMFASEGQGTASVGKWVVLRALRLYRVNRCSGPPFALIVEIVMPEWRCRSMNHG